jgi:hypothetical protein
LPQVPYKHRGILIAIEQHTRNFLGVQELAFAVFGGYDTFTLQGHNFLASNLFLTIVRVSNASREGFKFCLETRNNGALPLDLTCPEHLSV